MRQFTFLFLLIISISTIAYSQASSDFLNENPIHSIPEEMTFEEYQDMNRRLSVGLLLSAVPIPGTIHQYAGEKQTAKKIRRIAAASIVTIIVGITSLERDGWVDSPYQLHIINDGTENEIRYEMIPVGSDSEGTYYKYVELKRTYSGPAYLVPVGFSVLVLNYLYDYIHGIKTIEEKRDRVRYKYGRMLDFSMVPTYDMYTQTAGIQLEYKF